MKNKKITILGSTGSIGVQTLDVAEHLGLEIEALSGNANLALLESQIRRHKPPVCALPDEEAARQLRLSVSDTSTRVIGGEAALCEIAAASQGTVVNACVGFAGLRPTLAALEAGHTVALANKETLVAGGQMIMAAAKRSGAVILPIDSEHSAILQCLQGDGRKHFDKIILTASGGALRGYTREKLEGVTIAQVLAHPTWKMGPKITVDCATLMNKGLEVIEAAWLYDLPEDRIEVVQHPQSIIHSMVSFIDGSMLAQLGNPDMRLPIQYALTYPERMPSPCEPLDLAMVGQLTFTPPDTSTFRLLDAARQALRMGGGAPAVMNAANEVAVGEFLAGNIGFLDIERTVEEALARYRPLTVDTLEAVVEADRQGRMAAKEIIKSLRG